ncbi:MAG: glycosyl hydrolase family 17 [Candidatus Eisenbacteria bacterium]|uniref:Endo-1,3-beta-glucanase btgC n=1 Tax=Eiseniibacteriota bacterium TaxID=2212470 RepID=A0A7Y2EAF7_UNCEI|nr:glycosyl hydrolase family 17 [Candidatus Eisenbacteria bacterium]
MRPFASEGTSRWTGFGASYGPYRDGQAPGAVDPSEEELLEDLRIIQNHWSFIRTYGSVGPTEEIVRLIAEHDLGIKVMVGAWIAVEETEVEGTGVAQRFPQVSQQNRNEVDTAIRLANMYPQVVNAVCVGNETQVSWSAHRGPVRIVLDYVRKVRKNIKQPVTHADDYNYWNKPESRLLAREIDFIVWHAHPLWNGQSLENAIPWLESKFDEVKAMHPHNVIVIGETGWATQVHNEGEQARLITGAAGESEQAQFYQDIQAWSKRKQVGVYYFEVFDENWKGGPHPNEVEKHWGVYGEDRKPKEAIRSGSR